MSAASSQDKEKQAKKVSYGVDRLIAYVAPPPEDIPKEQYKSWANSHANNIHTYLQEYVFYICAVKKMTDSFPFFPSHFVPLTLLW